MKHEMIELAKTRSALEAIRKGLVRCGFELEFQSVNGCTEADEDRDPDEGGDPSPSPSRIIDVDKIEVGSDSSVRGGEARTVGALTPMQFMAAATALLNGYTFEIDTGCSFHIHLSVVGVKHTYGKNIQAEMQSFLLANQHRLPDSVKQRLKSDAIRFCKFNIDADKFTAVHGHPQKTWEFRLFGNIQNPMDAWRCLLLAIDTLRHAYQVQAKMTPSLLTTDMVLNFQQLASSAIKQSVGLKQVVREQKLFNIRQPA